MHAAVLLLIGLATSAGVNEYARGLGERALDQESFDAETYGTKKALSREADGLRIRLEAGADETGWKTPPQLKIGGDFTIIASVTIKKLPKPALEDGAAVGLAIAQGDINHPDLTFVRVREPSGVEVYRAIDRSGNSPGQAEGGEGPMMGGPPQPRGQPIAKAAKPVRRVFPAAGDTLRLELRREKGILRFQVLDARLDRPRYLGQASLGTNDIGSVKLFVSNRNGAEPLEVLWHDLKIRADRLDGLGTTVRTVSETVVYAEPTAIENGVLILGGPPKNPPPPAGSENAPGPNPPQAGDKAKTTEPPKEKDAEKPAAVASPAPSPSPAPSDSPAPATPVAAAPKPSEASPAPATASAPQPAPDAKPKEPKARIPLTEVESIRFERTPVMTAHFVGQKNVDLTRPAHGKDKDKDKDKDKEKEKDQPKDSKKAEPDKKDAAKKPAAADDALAPPPGTTVTKVPRFEPEKNGIADVGLALSGLRTAKIKQVTVNCQADKEPTGWRLDTTDSHDWPLVVRRAGTEPWAELYLEPPPGDSYQKDYRINIVYEDGQNGNATVKATEHTNPARTVDTKEPALFRPGATIHLTGDEILYGTLEGIGPETLRLVSAWHAQAPLEIPLARVVGVQLSVPDRKESPESFARRLKSRSTEDLLLARTKDGEVLPIAGLVEGTEGDRLQFRYQDRTRTIPLGLVEGWIMAARPDPRPADDLRARLSLFDGLAASGTWKDLDSQTWTFEVPWGQTLKIPAAEIREVRFRGGAMTHLCDLEPSRVEETPYFGHAMPWRRDLGLLGEPLSIDDQKYDHGIAVHSRCHLTYDLNRRFARFEAILGFDDAARGRGRVNCRVLADGKELFARTDLRADQPPVPLSLAVAGAEQLRLEVDFGPDQDAGDRVIWANPRLFRAAAPTPVARAAGAGTKPGP